MIRGWSRRQVLGFGAGLAASTLPYPTLAHAAAKERTLSFENLHTGERMSAAYWAEGAYIPEALTEINHLLRDFRTDEVRAIDVSLLDVICTLRRKLGTAEAYHVISGYRSPKTNATLAEQSNGVAKRSLHMRGMAIDVRLPGVGLARLREAAMALKAGGVGYYPKSDFVHIDVGRVRSW